MLFRSTGLGNREVAVHIEGLQCQGDHVILRGRTAKPVVWKVKVALTFKDMAKVLKVIVRVPAIGFMLSPSQRSKKKAEHPGTF
jgi:hypothetical protein